MNSRELIQPTKSSLFLMGLVILVPLAVCAQSGNLEGKAVIKVRAIYDDNEHPVRRANITMQSDTVPRIWRQGVTDAKGEVVFNKVAAGTYMIMVGFAGVTNGGSSVSGKSSATVDESSKTEIEIRTKRGGALTGKISYPDGEPVIGAKVTALMKTGKRWTGFIQPVATDDRGIYRIYPLDAGEYIVSAVEEGVVVTELPEGGTGQTTTNMSVAPYFYGGGNGFKSAHVIQLEAGRELTNINIALTERAVFKVSGTVVGGGEPLAGAYLSLRVREDGDGEDLGTMQFMGAHTESDKKGAWSFNNVPEGSYYIELVREQPFNPSQAPALRDTRRFAWQPYPLIVANGDSENIVLSAAQGARVSGSVTVEGDKPIPRGEIFLRPSGARRSQFSRYSTQLEGGNKGTFKLEGIPGGEQFLLMNVWDHNYYVKSVTWNERDLMRVPLTLGEGNELKGVRIVLATDISIAKGRLVYADNRPVGPDLIWVVPVDESRWPTSSLKGGFTDKQGNFAFRGAPGEYWLIVARPGDEPGAPGHLHQRITGAPRVSLRPGEQDLKEIVLPVP